MSTVVEPKDMTLLGIQAEIRKLERRVKDYENEDDVFPEDANRLDELRKEEKNRTRTKLSMAPRTGKIKEIAITPSKPLLSHAPSTNVAIANMEAEAEAAEAMRAAVMEGEMRDRVKVLEDKTKKFLIPRTPDENVELQDLESRLIAIDTVAQVALEEKIKKSWNTGENELRRMNDQKIADETRAQIERNADTIRARRKHLHTVDADAWADAYIQNNTSSKLIEKQNSAAGGKRKRKSKSKKRKSKKRKSKSVSTKHKKTIKHK